MPESLGAEPRGDRPRLSPSDHRIATCIELRDRGDDGYGDGHGDRVFPARTSVQLGDRPFFLIDGLDDSRLKDKLQSCKAGPFYKSNFSIAHRGAPLQFPEHTKEEYEAGARQGAGVVECDVTFPR